MSRLGKFHIEDVKYWIVQIVVVCSFNGPILSFGATYPHT